MAFEAGIKKVEVMERFLQETNLTLCDSLSALQAQPEMNQLEVEIGADEGC